MGSRGRAPGQVVRVKPPRREAEGILSLRIANEAQICPFLLPYIHFLKNIVVFLFVVILFVVTL